MCTKYRERLETSSTGISRRVVHEGGVGEGEWSKTTNLDYFISRQQTTFDQQRFAEAKAYKKSQEKFIAARRNLTAHAQNEPIKNAFFS